jgi:hypothetical protein
VAAQTAALGGDLMAALGEALAVALAPASVSGARAASSQRS